MNQKRIWEYAIKRAVKKGFDLSGWLLRNDQKEHERTVEQQTFLKCSFQEAFIERLTLLKMKALAFSHEFALCFFPKSTCPEECEVCKVEGGHEKYITEMKEMCTYTDFTFYLEIILDEEENDE